MINDTFFEIPIYSCDQNELAQHVKNTVDHDMAQVKDFGNGFWQKQWEEEYQRRMWPVRFNALVGYIEVHIVGTQLRADWWFTDKKKIFAAAKDRGVIRWVGKLIEKGYSTQSMTSAEIFNDFRSAIVHAVKTENRLKRRFIDYSAFDRIGPYVDWLSILQESR